MKPETQTQLNDRILQIDGMSICNFNEVEVLILSGVKPKFILCNTPSTEIDQFNRLVSGEDFIDIVGAQIKPLSHEWQIPNKYKTLNVHSLVLDKLEVLCADKSDEYILKAVNRVELELKYFVETDSIDFIRCIVYIIDYFKDRSIFWGVGRGSSCASMVLFLLELHLVDPIYYDLPITDFIKL